MIPEDIYKHLKIKHEQTCYDYIEDIDVEGDTVYLTIFIEPTGHMTFKTKEKEPEKIASLLSEIFNSQPLSMDYATAGWVLRTNHIHRLLHQPLEHIDVNEFWSRYLFDNLNTTNIHTIYTVSDMYNIKTNTKRKLLFRLGDVLDHPGEDVVLAELIYMKYLGEQQYLCLFDTSHVLHINESLGLKVTGSIYEIILTDKDGRYLHDDYIKEYDELYKEDMKKEVQGYQKVKDNLCYDEYLDRINKKNEEIFEAYKDDALEYMEYTYNIPIEQGQKYADNTDFKKSFLAYPENYEFTEISSITKMLLRKNNIDMKGINFE